MLDTSVKNLRSEIDEAIKRQEVRTSQADAIVQNMRGTDYIPLGGSSGGERVANSYENMPFEYVIGMLPQLAFQNPSVKISGRGIPDEVTAAMEGYLTTWMDDVGFVTKLRRIALDSFACFGVAEVYLEPDPAWDASRDQQDDSSPETTRLRPNIARVSPKQFFVDPLATHFDEARFYGKLFLRDADDLKNARDPMTGAPVYDALAVSASTVGVGDEFLQKRMLASALGRFSQNRNSVMGYEVFVPETGMIYCLGAAGDTYLRPPRPYGGSAAGPFVMFGQIDGMDEPYPITQLQVAAPLNDEINAHASRAANGARKAKRLHLVEGKQKGLARKIQGGDDDDVVEVDGLTNGAYQSTEFGGASEAALRYLMVLRERADRQLGLTQARRGSGRTGNSATADALADQGFADRVSIVRTIFQESIVRVLKRVGYLAWTKEQVRSNITWRNPATGKPASGVFVGGLGPGQQASDFARLDIRIEPYSMQRMDEAIVQKRQQDRLAVVSGLVPLMAQYPMYDWETLLNTYGSAFNEEGFGTKFLRGGQAVQAAAMQQQMAAAMGGGAGQPTDPGSAMGDGVSERAALATGARSVA